MNTNKLQALQCVESKAQLFCHASDEIWNHPETAFAETKSAQIQCQLLKELGFCVTENLADIPTAFSGRYGEGKPVIGILGEFDALSGMSQQADSAIKQAIQEGAAGHGCGHNLLGIGSIAAAAAVKQYLIDTKQSGTVIYYGCPGEEGGSGKAFMTRDGVFNELDCALSWHPGDTNLTAMSSSLANYQINYRFHGISAHAAACPHLGRSALDAVELMNVGVQFLREHVIPETRIHYAITNTGGYSPNVVQANAEVLYLIRAPKTPQVAETYERINDIARGAALMTGTQVDIEFIKACSNIVPNKTIAAILQNNLEETPLPDFTESEQEYATQIAKTIFSTTSSLDAIIAQLDDADANYVKSKKGMALNHFVVPISRCEAAMPGSSDVGDVSWLCPTAQISATTMVANTPAHSWQLVSQGKSDIAHKGMLYAAKVMAATAIDLINSPEIVKKAQKELAERLGDTSFVSPIPAGIKPMSIGNRNQ